MAVPINRSMGSSYMKKYSLPSIIFHTSGSAEGPKLDALHCASSPMPQLQNPPFCGKYDVGEASKRFKFLKREAGAQEVREKIDETDAIES